MELQKCLTEISLEKITSEHLLSSIEDKDYTNVYLLKYDREKSDINNILVRECRGIILEKETNKVVCYGLNKMNSKNEFEKIASDIWSECKIEDSIDGTQIRLYYNNKWVITTARCIDGYKSKWNYVKSYGILFDDVKHLVDLNKLNKNYTYTFIMKHVENRIIENVKDNDLYHIHTRDNISLNEVEHDIGVKKPTKYHFESLKDLKDELGVMTFETMGYVVSYENEKYMYRCKEYESVKELKENNKLESFLFYFPEYEKLFKYTEDKLLNLYKNIHNLYLNKFIYKNIEFKDINITYRSIIYNLHGLFKETNNPTTLNTIEEYVNTLKVGHIIKLLKDIKKI